MNALFRKPAERALPRIGALPKLPVFFDLAGRNAIVIGGTEAAAWKAELLSAAGAIVTVFAAEVECEMAAVAGSRRIRILRRDWRGADLSGAKVIVADVADDHSADRIRTAAAAAGVPVNVIDRPAHCDFQFGSIVNRAPVVIGISTDGVAPILGQAIRRRMEALLPRSIAEWAAAVKPLRALVAERIADAKGRRAFWEHFADYAFSREPGAHSHLQMMDLMDSCAGYTEPKGRVTFVGAGPGDAEYLTLKAVRALQSADAILFDDLISDEVLELARREAKRVPIGNPLPHSRRQENINDLTIEFAARGCHVVRLEHGDPLTFGRVGEEIVGLERRGIAVEVVPGISASTTIAIHPGWSQAHREPA